MKSFKVKTSLLFLTLILGLFLTGCTKEFNMLFQGITSKEVERIQMNGIKTYEKTIILDYTKVIEFWTDLDVTYYDSFGLTYNIEAIQSGRVIFNKLCDAVNHVYIKMFFVESNNGYGAEKNKYQGKMDCDFYAPVPKDYSITIKATPNLTGDLAHIDLKKYDIIIKQ